MRKVTVLLTVFLWGALLLKSWPVDVLMDGEAATSARFFIMLLISIALVVLRPFPLLAATIYLIAAALAFCLGPLGYTSLALYGVGLLVLTWMAFGLWRRRRASFAAAPRVTKPAWSQIEVKTESQSRTASPRRIRISWAMTTVGVAMAGWLLYVAQPNLPAVVGLTSGSGQADNATEQRAPSGQNGLQVVAYVDEIFWRVLAVEDLGQTLEGAGPLAGLFVTGGKFVQVRVEIENRSDDIRIYDGFTLVEEQAGATPRSVPALWYVPKGESCLFAVLRPSTTRTCTEIFELTAEPAALQARVSDLKLFDAGGQNALVMLGFPILASPAASENAATVLDTLLTFGEPSPIQSSVKSRANLRAGPGSEYAATGSLTSGEALDLAGQNAGGDWYQLRSGAWIAAFLVDGAPPDLPVVE